MKNKKYNVPVGKQYASVLKKKNRLILTAFSIISWTGSLISAIRLWRISEQSFNLSPAGLTFYLCEGIMTVSMFLTVIMNMRKKETVVSYRALMGSYGLMMISGLAGMLFGMAAFQKRPGSTGLLWKCIITASVTGICSAVVYTSYHEIKTH